MTSLIIRVDMENNAEDFWGSFHEAVKAVEESDPEVFALARELQKHGEVEINDPAAIERFDAFVHSIHGFDGGPEHAPTALIFQAV